MSDDRSSLVGWGVVGKLVSLSEVREYIHVAQAEAFFEDAEDYEPDCPLAEIVGRGGGDAAGIRSRMRSGDYPGAMRAAVEFRKSGGNPKDLAVHEYVAWSLLNWLPASDGLRLGGQNEALISLVLARQSIALGKYGEAVALLIALTGKYPHIAQLKTLLRIAELGNGWDQGHLAELSDEVEARGDCSLRYSLALVECRRDRTAGIARLRACVEQRPDVPSYTGRLMYELMSDRRYTEALEVFEGGRGIASTYYIARRSAVLCRGAVQGPMGSMEDLCRMYREVPFDRILQLNLIHALKTTRSYAKVLPFWIRSYASVVRAWPEGGT